MYCVVQNCRRFWTPKSNIKFHSFPKDLEKRNNWLSIVPLKGKFYSSAKICSLVHFKPHNHDPVKPGLLRNSATSTKACCSTEPSTSTAQQSIRSASINTEVLEHESKVNFLFTALTSLGTMSSYQVPGTGSTQLKKEMDTDAEYEPPTKRPCLKDFNIQVKMKLPSEMSLQKSKKILKKKIYRQQQKICSMQTHQYCAKLYEPV